MQACLRAARRRRPSRQERAMRRTARRRRRRRGRAPCQAARRVRAAPPAPGERGGGTGRAGRLCIEMRGVFPRAGSSTHHTSPPVRGAHMPVPGQMWPPPGQARRPPCGVCAHGTYDHRRALHVGLGMQPRGLFFIPPLPQGGLRRGYGHDCRTPATWESAKWERARRGRSVPRLGGASASTRTAQAWWRVAHSPRSAYSRPSVACGPRATRDASGYDVPPGGRRFVVVLGCAVDRIALRAAAPRCPACAMLRC